MSTISAVNHEARIGVRRGCDTGCECTCVSTGGVVPDLLVVRAGVVFARSRLEFVIKRGSPSQATTTQTDTHRHTARTTRTCRPGGVFSCVVLSPRTTDLDFMSVVPPHPVGHYLAHH